MGKKVKIGKARRDKFYHLAKETGYRSRAAFKLIQLNRKFEFLQKSRVVVDLCAAPGGWLQVAAAHTPVSSLIVGVDLVPIRPIHRVVTLQEDITTDKCRQALKKELQTWQADCVLNDGAPNVGKSWVHDAYQQAELTLHALKLATEFLRKGGWFITKVFRSKDYFSLMWVFQQLFKHVFATKPQASRNESAEIFVVCQSYLAPDRLDPKFLDPKHVFKDVEEDVKQTINLIHPEKKQRHREGYAEGDYTLYHVLKASEFLQSEDFMEKLAASNEIALDEAKILEHPATTTEIKECCKDIRVLGKKDIRSLLSWRKVLLKDFQKMEAEEQQETKNESAEGEAEEGLIESEVEEQEMQEILAKANEEELKQIKRKKRKTRKMQSKLRQKMDLKMILPNDRVDYGDDAGVFNLNKIQNQKQLDKVQEGDLSFMDGDIMEEDEDENAQKKQRLMEAYDRDSKDHLDGDYSSDEEGEEEPEFDDEEEVTGELESAEDNTGSNPLVVDLESKSSQAKNCVALWFNKEVFDGLEKEEDEDIEIDQMTTDYEKRGGTVLAANKEQEKKRKKVHFASEEIVSPCDSDLESDVDSDSDSDYEIEEVMKIDSKGSKDKSTKVDKKAGFEVVPVDESKKLDPSGLAIGAAMTHSKKRKREIIESAYNRYMYGDENLPEWFVKDEGRHCHRQLPVTKEEVQEYMTKKRAINARPIKKVAEAKARKKRKMMKRMEKARKKAEAITDAVDVSDKEKMHQIKQIYKKAGLLKKQKEEVTYVVAKKGTGKRVRRPPGVTGRFKVVDPRMKKDNRASKGSKGKGKGKGTGKNRAKSNKKRKN